MLTEANLYEPFVRGPLLSGAMAVLGDGRDAIGRTGGMEVIIEQDNSFRFSQFVVK
jgi:hypothetical protein